MVFSICNEVFGGPEFEFEGNKINFNPPWQRVSMVGAIKEKTGVDVISASDDEILATAKKFGIDIKNYAGRAKLIDELFSTTVELSLIQPTFIMDYPLELSPLAKKHRSKEGVVERFEGYVAGREICNAFSELNDPLEQKQRFLGQSRLIEEGDEEAHQVDEDFIRALEYGMPPTAGLGIGIDRLTMLFTGQLSIRDVIFFPQMKTEVKG